MQIVRGDFTWDHTVKITRSATPQARFVDTTGHNARMITYNRFLYTPPKDQLDSGKLCSRLGSKR